MPPEYAQDLLDYTERLGENTPDEALQDPNFKKRALSREAPMVLVYRVASAVENVDTDPTVQSLTDFERARVLLALDRKKEAYDLYERAYEESGDTEIRALSLLGMSNSISNFGESETLIIRAIEEEGYLDGHVYWATLYFNEKRYDETVDILKTGIRQGNVLSVGMLVYVYAEIYGEDCIEFESLLLEAARLAVDSGIENWWDEPFRQFNQQFFPRTKDGKVVNYVAVMEPLRKAWDSDYNQTEE
jgi:tetratricopeptide (TPR) repeat protein